jgi:hypothetical protein
MRRNNKIFELLKGWRLEGGVIDRIEAHIRRLIDWFDAQNKLVAITAEAFGATIRELREHLDQQSQVHEVGQKTHSALDEETLERIFTYLNIHGRPAGGKRKRLQGQQQKPQTGHGKCGRRPHAGQICQKRTDPGQPEAGRQYC